MPSIRGMRRVEVPLWVALILKAQDKCNIIPPSWLTFENLKSLHDKEAKNLDLFSQLPWNWLAISKILLMHASDDLHDPEHRLFLIIQDLKEIRQLKARRGLRELNESNIQMDGLSCMEINEIRPFVIGVMKKLYIFHSSADVGEVSDNE